MTDDAVVTFYDRWAPDHHLRFEDWPRGVCRQVNILDSFLTCELRCTPLSILDCPRGMRTKAVARPLLWAKLGDAITVAGLRDVCSWTPVQTGFLQPIVTARRGND